MLERPNPIFNKPVDPSEDTAQNKKANKGIAGGETFDKMLFSSLAPIKPEETTVTGIVDRIINQNIQAEARKPADAFDGIIKVVFKHEGHRLVKNDGGKGASRFGILESTARQYGYKGDIKNISQAEVEGIYRKMWEKSGAASLPYPLSLVHFDTYVNSPGAAKKLLEKSGGDIDTYLQLREKRYRRLAELRPERYGKYLKGWTNRINSLRASVNEHRMIASVLNAPPNPAFKIESKDA
ncbi:MAG TPA: hypothetical protein DHV16_03340 [Nitrospiraceae bacterium]|nr:MAG: hypothetical protein A2Z82_10885 [Nitrospirae bacterium GWA2_46_11]OGW22752.1 MAG: hypothetical protein A2X55_02400 [Nitrospirae bacterium GWB2_47_37]HAK89764.1 hypothetical protein [Nitrospiraceae bacterium]HCZ11291.1 hypothetical protein [Nitrospiraceae bacterium]